MAVEMEAEAIAIKKEMVVNMEADNVRWSELYPFSDPSKLQVPSLLIRSRLPCMIAYLMAELSSCQ
jgi:hypothetical protein